MVSASELEDVLAGDWGLVKVNALFARAEKETLGGYGWSDNDWPEAKQHGLKLCMHLEKEWQYLYSFITGEVFWTPKADNLISLGLYAQDTVSSTDEAVRYIEPVRVADIAAALTQTTYAHLCKRDDTDWAKKRDLHATYDTFYLRAADVDNAVLQVFE